MKRFCSKFSIMLMTFAFSLTIIWGYEIYKEVIRSLNNSSAVININPDLGKSKTFVLPIFMDGELMKVEIDENERFTLIGHGCGNGYAQGYITNEGERLGLGLEIIKPKDFKKQLLETEILESIGDYSNNDGDKGTRFILKGENKETSKEFYEIVWYDLKSNKYYITAPSLELALELEQWQKARIQNTNFE